MKSQSAWTILAFLLLAVSTTGNKSRLRGLQDVLNGIGQIESNNSIIGGGAVLESLPWQVQFYDDTCGATLIRDNIVLTAAHCVKDVGCPPSVLIGTKYRDDTADGDEISVQSGSCIVHPDYKIVPNRADLAVFKLTGTSAREIITLNNDPHFFDNFTADDLLQAYGFGRISNEQGTGSQVLKVTNERYYKDCKPYLGGFYVPQDMICVNATDGGGICEGDSGGPLVYQLNLGSKNISVQVGIASFVTNRNNCADIRTVDVFTNISNYYDWITDTADGLQNGTLPKSGSSSSGRCCAPVQAAREWVKTYMYGLMSFVGL